MDPVSVIGAVVSMAQLIEIAVNTGSTLIELVKKVQNVPEELRRQERTLRTIQTKLQQLQSLSESLPIAARPPRYLWEEFQVSLSEVQKDIEIVTKTIQPYETGKWKLRKKLHFQLKDQKALATATKRLKTSEKNLQRMERALQTDRLYSRDDKMALQLVEVCKILSMRSVSRSTSIIRRDRSSLLAANSSLRHRGFYMWLTNEQGHMMSDSSVLCLGFCLFTWFTLLSISLELSLVNAPHRDGWTLQWSFQVQNRVPMDSPLMKACQQGDVSLICQVLDGRRGNVNDRAICSGKTALSIAIDERHFEAIKCLLERGADPNIPDDDQVTPLFAVAGMNPRKNKYFEQLPPAWNHWLDTFRLLVQRGASLHERVRGRNIANLNIVRDNCRPKTLEYLRLLADELDMELDAIAGPECWSALQNALRSGSESVDALKVLSSRGVDLSKIMDDGRTALHLAAEWCLNSEPLEYLYSVGCQGYINKQDKWGWTPLHYAVIGKNSGVSRTPFSKIMSLLGEQADIKLEGGQNPRIRYNQLENQFTPYELLRFARPSRFKSLMHVLKDLGYEVEVEIDDGIYVQDIAPA